MYESEKTAMIPEEELVDILWDFIIMSANLAKKVNCTIKQKQIKKKGIINGENQRIEPGNQEPAQRRSHY